MKGLLLPPSIPQEPGSESESESLTEYDVKLLFSPMSNSVRQSNSTSFKNHVYESNISPQPHPSNDIFEVIVKGKLVQNVTLEKPEQSEKSHSSHSAPNRIEVIHVLLIIYSIFMILS